MAGRAARPLAPYALLEPGTKSRGQRRGIVRCDMRTRAGRLLKRTRAALLEHVGPNATAAQLSLCERIAFLELRAALFDQKIVDGTFTECDSKTYYAMIGAIRRCYAALGLNRPAPKFAELLRK
jgi:hypothetical protein